MPSAHKCDEDCICPEHGTQMYYAPASDVHACQEPDCEYAHGYEEAVYAELCRFLVLRGQTLDEYQQGRRSRGRPVEVVRVNRELL